MKEISEDDSTYDYKLITTSHYVVRNTYNSPSLKRTVEVVSPKHIISPAKKAKISVGVKSKVMPVSFSDKLKGLDPSQASAIQGLPGKVIVVSQPSQLNQLVVSQPRKLQDSQPNKPASTQANQPILVNSNGEVISAKPGVVFLNANQIKSQQTVITGPLSSNNVQMVPIVNSADLAKMKQQVKTGKATGSQLLDPSIGVPLAVINNPMRDPVSLLKPSTFIPTSDMKKFIMLESKPPPGSKPLTSGEIQTIKSKPKQVILDMGLTPSNPPPFVNTSSQVLNSFTSSQISSNIITQSSLSHQSSISASSTLPPNTFIIPQGSSNFVLPITGQGLGNGSSQQPMKYIALPISQPSQPQMTFPSLSNQLPGTVVLQSMVNGNVNAIPNGTQNMTITTSGILSSGRTSAVPNSTTNATSAVIQTAAELPQESESNVLQIIESADNRNQLGYEVLAELESADIDPGGLDNNQISETEQQSANFVGTTDENSNTSQVAIINEQEQGIPDATGAVSMHEDQITMLNSATEQSELSIDTSQQNDIDGATSSEQISYANSSAAIVNEMKSENMEEYSTVSNDGSHLGVTDSIETNGSQLQTTDSEMSVLVNGEGGLPADAQEPVQMETGDQEETLQIPATNIFQTEDGLVFIQNPDGTTVQIQGSDGQNIPLETIQALLSMDGETQLITEQQ